MLRELDDSELSILLELYKHLHTIDRPLPPQDEIEAIWKAIQKNPNLFYFGKFVHGILVSSCSLSIIPNLTRGCRPYGVIENVVTHVDFRRQGHGQNVLKYALTCAWFHDCYKVMLLTGRTDVGTYAFYESSGFDRHSKQAFIARPTKV